jgi:hypothetical protein
MIRRFGLGEEIVLVGVDLVEIVGKQSFLSFVRRQLTVLVAIECGKSLHGIRIFSRGVTKMLAGLFDYPPSQDSVPNIPRQAVTAARWETYK